MLQLEQDANLQYLGVIGMEDQLQFLVPETIKDCLKAGIKVWMITGDKLETAKNIGLACNLIEADMQPQLNKNTSLQEYMSAFAEARLIEITGQWAKLANNEVEMKKLFQIFDINKDNLMDKKEFEICMKALRFTSDRDTMNILFNEMDIDKNGCIDIDEFVAIMKHASPTAYEAVLDDINNGIERFSQIDDIISNPISILINRQAFQVLFPSKKKKKPKKYFLFFF